MKKLLTVILALVLSLSVIMVTACKKQEEKPQYKLQRVVDFESVYETMGVKLTAHEAQVSLNTDKAYVSSGEKSYKMHVNQAMSAIGYYQDTVLQLIPENINYFDYSNVVGVSMDIWNANAFNVEMCFALNNKATVLDYCTLKPGYNKVEFKYDNNQVISFTDRQLTSIDFCFYSGHGNEVLYIDNVCFAVTEQPYVAYDYTKGYKDGLVFGYEDFAEAITIIDLGGVDSLFSKPRTSINKDKRYVTQGEGSLRVDFYKSPKTNKVGNPVIRTYDNIMPDINEYTNDYDLTFDFYNATDKTVGIEFKVFSTLEDRTCQISVSVPANSWADSSQLRLPMTAIRQAFELEQISILTVVYGISNVDVGDTVYIDNLRFERSAV